MPAVAELKTQKRPQACPASINAIEDEQKRKDRRTLVAMMTKATNAKPAMWGPRDRRLWRSRLLRRQRQADQMVRGRLLAAQGRAARSI
jgi:hypothetical protein